MSVQKIDLSSQDEDITLFTDEEQVTVKEVNHEFEQGSPLKGVERKFTIFNDIHCYHYVKKKYVRKIRYRVNLTYLDPKPIRRFVLADGWMIMAAISAIASFLVIYAGWFSTLQLPSTVMITAASICISFCLISIMIALLRTQDRILMVSRHGRIPILELINNNPNKKAFHEFMRLLGKHIISAQHQAHRKATDHLTAELKELRRLKNETVIDDQAYEMAKKRIFANPAFKTESVNQQ